MQCVFHSIKRRWCFQTGTHCKIYPNVTPGTCEMAFPSLSSPKGVSKTSLYHLTLRLCELKYYMKLIIPICKMKLVIFILPCFCKIKYVKFLAQGWHLINKTHKMYSSDHPSGQGYCRPAIYKDTLQQSGLSEKASSAGQSSHQ